MVNQPEVNTDSESAQTNDQTISTLENNEALQQNSTAFFSVSEGRLITLYILSFGLYGVYWFYKNWKLQKKSMDKKSIRYGELYSQYYSPIPCSNASINKHQSTSINLMPKHLPHFFPYTCWKI
jgi:hypothetical protein